MAIKGYWKFEGNSNDYSENGNNGTDTDITYSNSAGVLGQGAGFNGTSSKITASVTGLPTKTAAISIMVWVNLRSQANKKIANRWAYPNSSNSFSWLLDDSTWRTMYGNNEIYASFGTLPLNKKILLTGTWDGTNVNANCKTYVNAVFKNSGSNYMFGTTTEASKLTIGAGNTGASYDGFVDGNIDELKIFSHALNVATIKNEYARVKGFF